MVLEIVQKSHFIVPANFIGEDRPFNTPREQAPLHGYSYYFNCQEKDEKIGIYLYMVITKPVTVSCTFIVNSITRNYVHIFNKSESWGFPQFGKKSELFVDGAMTVDAKLNIKFISENVEFFDDELPPSHTVALLEDDEFKDFTICAADKEIKVHKNIIAIASSVFSAMLKSHTKEFKEGRVDIEDFDFDTVKAGVDLMYTRKIPEELSLNSLLNLYKFADKYNLIDTKKVFEELTEKISLETVLEITSSSLANCLSKLYEECVEFYGKDFEGNSRKMNNFEQLDSQFLKDAARKKYRL